ncbi:MAG: hypothetical protein AAGD07_11310 [Planctomycetota bacterium]
MTEFPYQRGSRYNIAFCPICGGGLCGIRVCGEDKGCLCGIILCDECEAIWERPDVQASHAYPDPEQATCPKSGRSLYGETARWATADDVIALGWVDAVDPDLTLPYESENPPVDESIA